MVNVQPTRFVIQVKDRYGEEIGYPKLSRPLFLNLNRAMFPAQMADELVKTDFHLPYSHDVCNFKYGVVKYIDADDVKNGILTLSYDRYLDSILPMDTKVFYLTDDTCVLWRCTNNFVVSPEMCYEIGGGLKQYFLTRGLKELSRVKISAPRRGRNLFLYVTLKC